MVLGLGCCGGLVLGIIDGEVRIGSTISFGGTVVNFR